MFNYHLLNNRIKGIVLTFSAIAFLSPDTLLFRLLKMNTWDVIFWRCLLVAIGLFCYLKIKRISLFDSFNKSGRNGYLIIVFDTASNVFFYSALSLTTAANTLIILSSVPIFSALLGRFILDDRIKIRTWFAIAMICPSVILLASGSHEAGSLLGDFFALGTALSISMSIISARKCGSLNMTPCVGMANLLTALITFPLTIHPLLVLNNYSSIILLLCMGTCSALAMTFLVIAPRYINAAEVSLFLPLETVIGSFLVWCFIGETIQIHTFIGGAIILCTVFFYSWCEYRDSKQLML